MSSRTISVDDALYDYILRVSLRESDVLSRLRAETRALPDARMQISPEQGQLMTLLARLIGATRAIEIGIYTGCSTICVASALPPTGTLVACDMSEEWTAIARRYWAEAGVADRIDLRLAPALDTLDALIAEGGAGTYDLVFIDADKREYADYYERALTLLRPGGLICVDNVLWGGSVVDPAKQSDDTKAIHAFNETLHADDRIELSLVPIGDGLTLARKRE